MGQSSSQPVPTQASHRAKTPARASTAPLQLTIDSTTISELEGGKARALKRPRISDIGGTQKKAKSRPQHRRGTAIQPKLDVPFDEDAFTIPETQESSTQHKPTTPTDAVAGAEAATVSPSSDIVVNKNYEKTWQIEERQRQEQLTQETATETQPDLSIVPESSRVVEEATSPKGKKSRKRRRSEEDHEVVAGVIEETPPTQDENPDGGSEDGIGFDIGSDASLRSSSTRQRKLIQQTSEAETTAELDSILQEVQATTNAAQSPTRKVAASITAVSPASTKKSSKRSSEQQSAHSQQQVGAGSQQQIEAFVEIPQNEADAEASASPSTAQQEERKADHRTRGKRGRYERPRPAEEIDEATQVDLSQDTGDHEDEEQAELLQDARDHDGEDQAESTESASAAQEVADAALGNTARRPLQAVMIERVPQTAEVRHNTDPMPTPPESPPEAVMAVADEEPEAAPQAAAAEGTAVEVAVDDAPASADQSRTSRKVKKTSKRIRRWMENGDFEAPPVQGTVSPPSVRPPQRSRTKPSARSEPEADNEDNEGAVAASRTGTTRRLKRKRSSQPDPDESDAYVDNEPQQDEQDSAGEPSTVKPKAKRRKTMQSSNPEEDISKLNNTSRGTVTGTWSAAEKAHAEQTWNDYIRVNHLDAQELRNATTDWPNIGPIKMAMFEAFPDRKLDAIRKFCQRHFSPYTTGPWSAEEDARLREAYARYPNQWSNISGVLFRSSDAVRDRWRLIVKDQESRQTGPWSVEEEERLRTVVEECVQLVRQDEEMSNKSRKEIEGALNWKVVSDKMGCTRGEHRCRQKWGKLKKRSANFPATSASAAASTPQRPAGTPGIPPSSIPSSAQALQREKKPKGTDRNAKTEQLYASLEFGDIYDALFDIGEAMKAEPDKVFPHETTLWATIAERRKEESKFAKYSALRRRAYDGALQLWGRKRSVRQAVGVPRKALAMMKFMLKEERKRRLILTRGWDKVLELAGASQWAKKVKTPKKSEEWLRRSDELVVYSDDDDGDDSEVDDTPTAARLKREVLSSEQKRKKRKRDEEIEAGFIPVESRAGHREAAAGMDDDSQEVLFRPKKKKQRTYGSSASKTTEGVRSRARSEEWVDRSSEREL